MYTDDIRLFAKNEQMTEGIEQANQGKSEYSEKRKLTW